MVQDPLVGTIPNLLGFLFVASVGALRFFWRKRGEDDDREGQVFSTRNLIWTRDILGAMRAFLEQKAPSIDLSPSPEMPKDLQERRFTSSSDEDAIRGLLDDVQQPMNDMDALKRLDSDIDRWIDIAWIWSFGSSVGILALIVLHGLVIDLGGTMTVGIALALVLGIGILALRVWRLESQFDGVRNRYKIYQDER